MPVSPARNTSVRGASAGGAPTRDTSARNAPVRGAPTAWFLAVLAAAQFVVALDYNIVYVALPDIGAGLGFGAQSLQWVVSSYAVTFGGLLLLGGRLVDRLGARRMFLLGLALFGLACLAGGLAGNPGTLLAARAVQGVGAAMLAPATLSLINTGFTEGSERTRALSVWSAAGSAGLAAGALLGGVLTELGGWRWVMFVMVPAAAAILGAAPRTLGPKAPNAPKAPTTPRAPKTSKEPEAPTHQPAGLDIPGVLLATAGSTLLVFGLVSGPEAGWASLRGAGAIVLGVVLLGAFLLVEQRTRDPLVPLRLFGNRSLAVAMAVILVFQSGLGGAYYVFTTYLQNGLGYSALRTGLAFVPVTVLSVFAGMRLGPALIGRRGLRTTLFVGMLGNGLGIGTLALGMSSDGSFAALLPGILIWGIGGGITFTAMFVTAASGVDAREQGIASALATTAQQLGGAAGLAVLIAVANAHLDPNAGPASPADLIDGLRTAGLVAGAAAVLGAFLAFTLKRPPTPEARNDTDTDTDTDGTADTAAGQTQPSQNAH
ncbi:MFS transporter [Embleya sp. NPDC127516]|uniref:MFS transporter n=1 Tax=Embleya sp. NPDC127516 TaxID=3363990 RepID=UPI003800633C